MSADLNELFAAYKADPTTLDNLLHAVMRRAANVASGMMRGSEFGIDKEDVAQETAMAIWRKLGQPIQNFGGLVTDIAKRKTVDAIRRIRKTDDSIDSYIICPPNSTSLSEKDEYRLDVIEVAMGPEVVDLLMEGLSYEEIARETGVRSGTLRMRARRIRRSVTKTGSRNDTLILRGAKMPARVSSRLKR